MHMAILGRPGMTQVLGDWRKRLLGTINIVAGSRHSPDISSPRFMYEYRPTSTPNQNKKQYTNRRNMDINNRFGQIMT